MPKKKTRPRKKARKVQVTLPESLIRALDMEVKAMASRGRSVSRSSLMKEMLGLSVVRRMASEVSDPASMADVRESLLKEAGPLAQEAGAQEASGSRTVAARLWLVAAAREIEAMAYTSDETAIKSAIVLAVMHLKRGTGYRHLPEVHVAASVPGSVQ